MATFPSQKCAKSNFRYPLITPPPSPELVDQMRGRGWTPHNKPLPHSGHYVIEPTLDFAHFLLGGVATGIRVLGINQSVYYCSRNVLDLFTIVP